MYQCGLETDNHLDHNNEQRGEHGQKHHFLEIGKRAWPNHLHEIIEHNHHHGDEHKLPYDTVIDAIEMALTLGHDFFIGLQNHCRAWRDDATGINDALTHLHHALRS